MKKTLAAMATATVMTLAAVPASAMEKEFDMLTVAVFNALTAMNLPTDNIRDLSLSEIAQIHLTLSGSDNDSDKRRAVEVILDRH